VVYKAKDGKDTKVFPAMEWLATMCSHIPNKDEQMVRYYGYHSNVARGKRKEAGTDDVIPCIIELQGALICTAVVLPENEYISWRPGLFGPNPALCL